MLQHRHLIAAPFVGPARTKHTTTLNGGLPLLGPGAFLHEIVLVTYCRSDRSRIIDLPPDVPEGPAEVIVLVPEKGGNSVEPLLDGIDQWRQAHPECCRSKAEIDRDLARERASWNEAL